MPYQELPGLGMRGLNTDTPPQALDHTQFSAGLNMRPFDGSLQQVYAFQDEINDNLAGMAERDIYAMTQWTRTGEEALNIAYVYDHHRDGDNLRVQIVEDVTNTDVVVEGVAAITPFRASSRFNIEFFAFNDVLVLNDGYNHPVWLQRQDDGTYSSRLLPGWPSLGVTAVEGGEDYFVLDNTNDSVNWASLVGPVGTPNYEGFWDATRTWYLGDVVSYNNLFYRVISADVDGVLSSTTPDMDTANWVNVPAEDFVPPIGARVTILDTISSVNVPSMVFGRPTTVEHFSVFNNRLVAMNVSEEYLSSQDYGNSTVLFSTPITALGSLLDMEFVASSTNSAADDIVTETSGEILDGIPLGQYFILYKSDGIYRYTDVGDPLFIVGEPLTTDDGIYSPQCAVDIGSGRHFVVGNNGIYIHDGGPNKQNISRGRVERHFYSRVIPSLRDNTFVFHHVPDKEVWICYPHITFWDANTTYTGAALVNRYDPDTDSNRVWINWRSDGSDGFGDNLGHDPNDTGTSQGLSPFQVGTTAGHTFANTSNTYSWLEAEGTGCNFALVYNYETDTWYERTLPLVISNPEVASDLDDITWVDSPAPTPPSRPANLLNPMWAGAGMNGITLTESKGTLVIVGWGNRGAFNLRSERPAAAIENDMLTNFGSTDDNVFNSTIPGYVELHYLNFGDASKVKHLHALYPHTTESVVIDVDTTDNLGISGQPDFLTVDRVFDAASDTYKLDYRTHGRYYHLRAESNVVNTDIKNPKLTGIGMMIKLGGQR